MALFPNFPTDSLYKFIALFGIVLLAFGLWYPEQKFRESDAGIREAVKADALTRIRINRMEVQTAKLVDEVTRKTAALEEKEKPFADADAALEAKRNAVLEELDSLLKKGKGDVRGATMRAETMSAETAVLTTKMAKLKSEYNELNKEYRLVLVRQYELTDELMAENVNLKASAGKISDLKRQADLWFNQMISCIVVGWTLIISGFLLWWFRIQRYEDRILRKRASE